MTNSSPSLPDPTVCHSIADIERDTGLSKDTLRVWERRYGFPCPQRDATGERRYDDAQLLRLRQVRRLLDRGFRAGRLVPMSLPELQALERQASTGEARPGATAERRRRLVGRAPDPGDAPFDDWMALLQRQDGAGLRQALEQHLLSHGLGALVQHAVAPMNQRVGLAWLEGRLAVYEEHLYTEVVQGLLRHAMMQVSRTRPTAPPRVLLTSVPGEAHALGLLMAECFLVLEGCETVPLGVQTPLPDIVAAQQASGAHIVALGFGGAQNPRDVRQALTQLRQRLPPEVELWAGGRCPEVQRGRRQGGAWWPVARIEEVAQGVARWRRAHPIPDPAQDRHAA